MVAVDKKINLSNFSFKGRSKEQFRKAEMQEQ